MKKNGLKKLKGNKNYKSIVIGKVKVLKPDSIIVPSYSIEDTEKEVKKLLKAIKKVKDEVQELQNKINPVKERDAYAIFDFYKLYLEDDYNIKEAIEEIKVKKLNAAYIIEERRKKNLKFFDSLEDPKMRSRKDDIDFLSKKVLSYLLKNNDNSGIFDENRIIFAKNVSPLDLIMYDASGIKAVVTQEGTFTSHTAIVANTLNISYMMGIEDCLNKVKDGQTVIIDGFSGEIIIDPDFEILREYEEKKKKQEKILFELEKQAVKKSFTKDGKHIKIMLNIDVIDAPEKIYKYNIEGIGLARSEFMFHDKQKVPSYEEQFIMYKELLLKNKGVEVTVRTFDFSEDKTPNTLKIYSQHNPSMGLRGIRFSFYKDIFKNQLKALINASLFGNLKILFPMISSYEEFFKIKETEKEILEELNMTKRYKLGIMLETISSVYLVDDLYKELDFISLGTNDLMQYFFAVDRSNGFVKDLSSPFSPSFLRFLNETVTKIKKYGLELSICGKIASVPEVTPVLIGLGINILSVSPLSIPIIKETVSKISLKESKELTSALIKNKTAGENEKLVNDFLKKNNIMF